MIRYTISISPVRRCIVADGRAEAKSKRSCADNVEGCRSNILICVNSNMLGSITTQQILNNPPGSSRGVEKGRERAHVQMHPPDACKARRIWVPSHTPNFNAIRPAVSEILKRGVHVRTCRCIVRLTYVKIMANWTLNTRQI